MAKRKKKTPVIREWTTGDRLLAQEIQDMPLDENEQESERKLKELEKRLKNRKI